MTGRRLYDHHVDAVAKQTSSWDRSHGRVSSVPPSGALSWPFLTQQDRDVWNDLARRITPKARKAKIVDSGGNLVDVVV